MENQDPVVYLQIFENKIVFDLFDYFITYNTKWVGIISFNVVSMIILAIIILFDIENDRV